MGGAPCIIFIHLSFYILVFFTSSIYIIIPIIILLTIIIASVSELSNCATCSHFALYVCMYLCQSRLGPGVYQVASYASAARVSRGSIIIRVLMFGGARVFWGRAYLLMIVAIIVVAVLSNTISIKETTELYNLCPFIDYQSSL